MADFVPERWLVGAAAPADGGTDTDTDTDADADAAASAGLAPRRRLAAVCGHVWHGFWPCSKPGLAPIAWSKLKGKYLDRPL